MNLSAPFIAQFFTSNVKKILPHIDILIANESEAEAWATATNYPGPKTDLQGIAQSLSSYEKSNTKRPRTVIFTHGDKETVVVPGPNKEKFITVPVKPLGKDEIVDTNGAGDAFAGGFVAAYVLGKGLEESVLLGHRLAAMCVQQVLLFRFFSSSFCRLRCLFFILVRVDLNTSSPKSTSSKKKKTGSCRGRGETVDRHSQQCQHIAISFMCFFYTKNQMVTLRNSLDISKKTIVKKMKTFNSTRTLIKKYQVEATSKNVDVSFFIIEVSS